MRYYSVIFDRHDNRVLDGNRDVPLPLSKKLTLAECKI